MKNWSTVDVVEGVSYRLKVFRKEDETGYDLLLINDADTSYEIIDSDTHRAKLVDAREEYASLLKGLHPTMILSIDKSLA